MRVRVSSASLEDTFRFKKGLDSVPSVLPADARELEATPGRVRVIRHPVDDDAAGADLGGDATCPLQIGTEDGAVQPVPGVVGEADGFVVGVVRDDAKHGAEDL